MVVGFLIATNPLISLGRILTGYIDKFVANALADLASIATLMLKHYRSYTLDKYWTSFSAMLTIYPNFNSSAILNFDLSRWRLQILQSRCTACSIISSRELPLNTSLLYAPVLSWLQ